MSKTQTPADKTTDTNTDSPALLSWRVVATRLGVHPVTVRDWTAEGLPCYRISPRITRYRWPEVEAWLAARREGGVL